MIKNSISCGIRVEESNESIQWTVQGVVVDENGFLRWSIISYKIFPHRPKN
jgi:hypothetical protein